MSGSGLLVVGDVVTDVVARHGMLSRHTDNLADIALRAGGSAANTAAWAAHLGADVRLLARVGADTADWHRAQLAAAGVRAHLSVDPDHPTAAIVVLVDTAGERTMLTHRGAGGMLGPADWDDTLLDGVGLLHISGYTLFSDSGQALAALAMAAARHRGIPISVDPASTAFLATLGVDRFLDATRTASVILPNQDEATLLTGERDPAAAAVKLSGAYPIAIVKLGPVGALAARDGAVLTRTPAAPATTLDSTGAGDAFAAGFLTARLTGASLPDALTAGCQAGAQAVTHLGGRP